MTYLGFSSCSSTLVGSGVARHLRVAVALGIIITAGLIVSGEGAITVQADKISTIIITTDTACTLRLVVIYFSSYEMRLLEGTDDIPVASIIDDPLLTGKGVFGFVYHNRRLIVDPKLFQYYPPGIPVRNPLFNR